LIEQRNNDLLLVDDRDDLDPEAERAAWQLRELERIKRDRKIERERQKEMEELERRREMTDAERRRDDLEAGIDRFKKDKGQMKFMQRFYHKGAFYQDQEIMQRDFTAPTLEDRFNKEVLPEVLQRRQNIGLRGATKWTHLANEDTSQV
jgi:microfibrillar-associated protein 1